MRGEAQIGDEMTINNWSLVGRRQRYGVDWIDNGCPGNAGNIFTVKTVLQCTCYFTLKIDDSAFLVFTFQFLL